MEDNTDSNRLILFGLDGIIDAIDEDKYTYKKLIANCFERVFPMHNVNYDRVINRSRTWALSKNFRILVRENADYEEFLLHYLEWVLEDTEVDEFLHSSFISKSKEYFRNLIIYQDIIDYMEKLTKACKVGIVTDRDWFGYTIATSLIDERLFSFVQHYWPEGYFKDNEKAWYLAKNVSHTEKDNILIVDTSEDVISFVKSIGFNGYVHREGDVVGLTREVNKFLS